MHAGQGQIWRFGRRARNRPLALDSGAAVSRARGAHGLGMGGTSRAGPPPPPPVAQDCRRELRKPANRWHLIREARLEKLTGFSPSTSAEEVSDY